MKLLFCSAILIGLAVTAAWLTRPEPQAAIIPEPLAAPIARSRALDGQLLSFGRLERVKRVRAPAFDAESRLDQEVLDRYAQVLSRHRLKKIDDKWSRALGDSAFAISARMLLVLQRLPAPDFSELQLIDHAQARLSANPELAISELGNALTLLPTSMQGDRMTIISTLSQLGHLSPAATQAARASLYAAIEHSAAPIEGVNAFQGLNQLRTDDDDSERFVADAREALVRAHPREDLRALESSNRLPAGN